MNSLDRRVGLPLPSRKLRERYFSIILFCCSYLQHIHVAYGEADETEVVEASRIRLASTEYGCKSNGASDERRPTITLDSFRTERFVVPKDLADWYAPFLNLRVFKQKIVCRLLFFCICWLGLRRSSAASQTQIASPIECGVHITILPYCWGV